MLGTNTREFDVAIVGGGIGGSALACILARHGIRVLLVEGGGHPRFAIGESTVGETNLGLRILAERYSVPELGRLAAHGTLRRYVSPACGVKRNFGFVYHREGESFRPTECTQLPTLAPPYGPEAHFFRQDVDAYLFRAAVRYGATALNYTPVAAVDFDADGATLHTATSGDYRAKFVVDAGGMNSLLGSQLQLRMDPPPYRTRSRTIFSHFVGVEPFDRIAPSRKEHGMRSPFSQGTLHHLFKGGWAWVIPFDNHINSTSDLCSVGINLDIDEYPRRDGESAEDEFWAHVNRFPDFRRQMERARAVRPFVATDRTQFASRQIVGERWCLLPHASDFIDPLFSSGLSVTAMALNALGHRLITAVREDDFAVERFEYVQTWTKKAFDYFDELVTHCYTAYDDFALWNAWYRVWTISTFYGVNTQMQAWFTYSQRRDPSAFQMLERSPYRGVQAIDNPECQAMFRAACTAMQAYRDKEIDVDEACDRIFTALRDSRLVPPAWKTLDPDNRCPAGTFTLWPLTRILLWGKFRSPEHVRGRYFKGGVVVSNKLTAKFFLEELARSASALKLAGRDPWVAWNRDWRKVGGSKADTNTEVSAPTTTWG